MPGSAQQPFDVLVVGGGIMGVSVARDAAGRGLSTVLVERDDLAAATSSASSKLIHGGLRYLEQGCLRLVRESLREREVLMAAAPHLVRPLPFVLPHAPGLRPRLLLRAGLLLYDLLGGARALPRSRAVRLDASPLGEGLRGELRHGLLYSDCRTDDARLVVAVARDAAARGARIVTRTELVAARREGGLWRAELAAHPEGSAWDEAAAGGDGAADGGSAVARGGGGKSVAPVHARTLVNAAGPWAARLLSGAVPHAGPAALRLVQGAHVVVPRLIAGDHALLLQHPDRRVVFVLPFGRAHSLVGTTDVPLERAPTRAPAATAAEIEYLCAATEPFLRRPPRPGDVVWSFAGVRALHDDGRSSPASASRDDVIDVEHADGAAPLASVFGGKLTTARRVAERVLDALGPWLAGAGRPWTAHAVLPGGEVGPGGVAGLLADLRRRLPGLDGELLEDLVGRHGRDVERVLDGVRSPADLGVQLVPGLWEREVAWFVEQEWARTADDVLWRRTKAGLSADVSGRAAVAECVAGLARRDGPPRPPPAGSGPARR